MTNENNNYTLMYGIWIKGKGWLRGKDVFADMSLEKASQVAKLLGGDVRFIDQSLIDLEQRILDMEQMLKKERQSLWDTLLNSFKRKSNI